MHMFTTKNITDDPHPVLLNITDNASTLLHSIGPTTLAENLNLAGS
jgi:hypothetical protein